ncbi:MAG: aminotransferase class I/II-fold pyridoxal phosphate-dependent enzyme [Clostridiales Family XIII bacterium]|jgi:histidinol-phosphate aminotransferase|nr:aminotransferase class I/II-fold pyridoxal phosphate-dependent enzyme [Clostridiales Family XIII bacterium]
MSGGWKIGLYEGEPYVSGEQPSRPVIKLNTNENPYPPSPNVIRAIRELDTDSLRLYPKQDGGDLRLALAAHYEVSKENVFVGNGSDEVLALAFRACFGTGKPVLFADVTYSFYPVWCSFFGIPYEIFPLNEDFLPVARDYMRPNGGIVLCDPNAPTGIGMGNEFLREILDANQDSVVIVDAAYADFAEENAVPLVSEYPNLLVTGTFSKSRSLAGLRIGFAIGSREIIRALMSAKDSFNSYPLDRAAIVAGEAAAADEEYFRMTTDRIKLTRDETEEKLRELGFGATKSQTNFIFAGCGSPQRAKDLFEYLRSQDIFVRYFDKPRINDRLRISVGRPEEMEALITEIEAFLKTERG